MAQLRGFAGAAALGKGNGRGRSENVVALLLCVCVFQLNFLVCQQSPTSYSPCKHETTLEKAQVFSLTLPGIS